MTYDMVSIIKPDVKLLLNGGEKEIDQFFSVFLPWSIIKVKRAKQKGNRLSLVFMNCLSVCAHQIIDEFKASIHEKDLSLFCEIFWKHFSQAICKKIDSYFSYEKAKGVKTLVRMQERLKKEHLRLSAFQIATMLEAEKKEIVAKRFFSIEYELRKIIDNDFFSRMDRFFNYPFYDYENNTFPIRATINLERKHCDSLSMENNHNFIYLFVWRFRFTYYSICNSDKMNFSLCMPDFRKILLSLKPNPLNVDSFIRVSGYPKEFFDYNLSRGWHSFSDFISYDKYRSITWRYLSR